MATGESGWTSPATVDGATSVALSGSKIIAARLRADPRLAILSLNSNGTVDSSFGVGTGRSRAAINELPQGANALAVQPDGKILVAGPGGGNFGVGRVKTDGFYDPSFGPNGNGQVAVDFGGNDVATAMTLQPDGKILVAGTDGDGFAVARLMPNGSPRSELRHRRKGDGQLHGGRRRERNGAAARRQDRPRR